MATEHVDGRKPGTSEDSSASTWNVTTTEMLIQFYKENRILCTLVPEAFIYSLLGNFATQSDFIIFFIGMKR